LPQGRYTLTAVAIGNHNANTSSAPVNIQLNRAPALHFIEADHLNTPRLIENQTQQAVWRWDQQEPFAVTVPDENQSGLGAFEFPLRFAGQYADKETNLHYKYFRDYDASIGRYAESDPLGLGGGINTYLYSGASPLTRIDPSGLVDWTGYQFAFASGFGAGYSQMDLFSECKCGRRYHIVVHGIGGAASVGVRLSATISEVTLDDGSACPDPTAFMGGYGSVSAGGTVNALPMRGGSIVGIGARGPGVGASVGISRFGDVSQPVTFNSARDVASPVIGRDLSITAVAGVTIVNVISVSDCCGKSK